MPGSGLKLEIGGGSNPHKKAEGFLNVDWGDSPLIDFKLNLEGCPWATGHGAMLPDLVLPWGDDSVSEVYACHVLEHLHDYWPLLRELARVCEIGATVYLRAPHWLFCCAMGAGHTQTISPMLVERWDIYWIWGKSGKKFKLTKVKYQPEKWLDEVRPFFGAKLGMSDEQIMRFIPDTSHEIHYWFEVVKNEPGGS